MTVVEIEILFSTSWSSFDNASSFHGIKYSIIEDNILVCESCNREHSTKGQGYRRSFVYRKKQAQTKDDQTQIKEQSDSNQGSKDTNKGKAS